MKVMWQGRVAQAAGKYGEHAPMATACCNACRTCVQTNLLSAAVAVVTAVIAQFARHIPRRAAEPS